MLKIRHRFPAFNGPLAVILFVLALGAGCSSFRAVSRDPSDSSRVLYEEALKTWTAQAQVYHGFDPILLATGTFHSSAFRRAFVNKFARDYHLDSEIKKKMLADEQAMSEKNIEFTLAVYTPDPENIRLDSKDSIWRIYIEKDDLGRFFPYEVRNLRKQRTRLELLYPYITPWNQVYRVRFRIPKPMKATGKLHLVMTGVLGEARLIFDLEG
ncbi:MAG: hypothetical protein JRD68_11540 [Deltaproteobacteria bacterium]|nr:hypothetical protein [Deltaproteobacteria bacterium]